MKDERAYAVVHNQGTDQEKVVASFRTYKEALRFAVSAGRCSVQLAVMKRLPDGSLGVCIWPVEIET